MAGGRGGGDYFDDPVRVALGEKNPLITRGLRSLFAEDGRLEVTVAATDGERFLECIDRLEFDVGVIGWVMPYCSGAAVLEALAKRSGGDKTPPVIVYTGDARPQVASQALALGAAGFCAKTDPPERLVKTILTVAEGQMVFPLRHARHQDPLVLLTRREREILQGLAQGKTNLQLAKALGVSANTIKFHLRNLYEKLGVTNRAGAVAAFLSGA